MPFIPHTEDDVREMLEAIGVGSIAQLFDEIPPELRAGDLPGIGPGMAEPEIARLMQARAAQDGRLLCFAGGGAYDHHIPAAVWEIVTRGEFYTAYTPYQAEASQGTLQLVWEYQSMMCALTGLDVSNASLYDGASALAEAVLMAVRANRKSSSKRVLMPASVNPDYRRVVHTIVRNQGVELVEVPFDPKMGDVTPATLDHFAGRDFAALVIPQPNFFGVLEEADALTDWAQANGMLAIALVNPVALAILNPPGQWGAKGADIACGEGQPLGAPLSSGGPYFGFMTCRQEHVRQMPGRIVGRTVDVEGKGGFTLTLQAREQHIRRSKATSNICTNQGLLAAAATVHVALLGPQGLERVAGACHANTRDLVQRLTKLNGVETAFTGPVFHEAVLRLPRPAQEVLAALADRGILGGIDLSADYPHLGNALLVCATELRDESDRAAYAAALAEVLA